MPKKSTSIVIKNLTDDKKYKRTTFDIHNIDVGILNALRRVILSEIPNFGIPFDPYNKDKTGIFFKENTSSLHNEFLGHRISLLPVQLDVDDFKDFDSKKYKCVIDVHNKTNELLNVTTNDIDIYDEKDQPYPSQLREKMFPVSPITNDPILIVKLNPNIYNNEQGEKLHVTFYPAIGIAHDHSRFCPVSTCTFYNIVDDEKAEEAFQEFRDKYPDEDEAMLRKRFDIHDRYRHYIQNEHGEPNGFRVTIESECRLSPIYLFLRAFDVLRDKLKLLRQEKRIQVSKLDESNFAHLLKKENHTLGNLIQVMFYNMFRRDQDAIDFIGYYLTHPSISEIVVKIKHKKDVPDVKEAHATFEDYLEQIEKELMRMKKTIQKYFE